MPRYTREQNIFIAKKLLSELVYDSAYVEGCNVTFTQTETILNGMKVSGVSVSDIQTVINLRDAWRYVLNHLDDNIFTVSYLCAINNEISRNESLSWGELRTGNVGISGTDFVPPLPSEEEMQKLLDRIRKTNDARERAATLFCRTIIAQPFWDGNKRTATLAANAALIQSGEGVFGIHNDNADKFNQLLHDAYSTGDEEPLKAFFIEECENISMRFDLEKSM